MSEEILDSLKINLSRYLLNLASGKIYSGYLLQYLNDFTNWEFDGKICTQFKYPIHIHFINKSAPRTEKTDDQDQEDFTPIKDKVDLYIYLNKGYLYENQIEKLMEEIENVILKYSSNDIIVNQSSFSKDDFEILSLDEIDAENVNCVDVSISGKKYGYGHFEYRLNKIIKNKLVKPALGLENEIDYDE